MIAVCAAVQIIEVPPNVSPTVTAVKPDGEEIDDMPVEALLGMDMAHPNVVQTYRHTSLITSVCTHTCLLRMLGLPLSSLLACTPLDRSACLRMNLMQ